MVRDEEFPGAGARRGRLVARLAARLVLPIVMVMSVAVGDAHAAVVTARPAAVVSIGDSMISGDGSRWMGNSLTATGSHDGTDRACTPASLPGTCGSDDVSSIYVDGTWLDQCMRSDVAEVFSAHIPHVTPVNLACAGAVTADLLPTSDGGQIFRGEAPQGDQLVKVARQYDVKMIAISIGINDLQGGGAVLACAEGYIEQDDNCIQTWQPQFNQAAAGVVTKIEHVVADVRTIMAGDGYAPGSYRILLQSYPDTLASGDALRYPANDSAVRIADGCPFSNADATWIRTHDFTLIASLVSQAAAASEAEYMNVLDLFDGHEVCSSHDSLVDASHPTSAATSEWARFFSLTADIAQGAPTGSSTVPAQDSVQDELAEILHPGFYGQTALGLCLGDAFASPVGDHVCDNVPGAGDTVAMSSTRSTASCTVPSLKGHSLAFTRRALQRARCGLGHVTYDRGTSPREAPFVVGQTRAGTTLPATALVAIRLGGPRRASLAQARPQRASATTTPAPGPVTGTLSRTGKWITDPEGRVVVLHGVDIVRKEPPYYPSSFSAQDAQFLADEGFTTARIGFIWAGAEPQPAGYDDSYINHVLALNDLLARYGIRTLIDIHQDSYATQGQGPLSTVCVQNDVCDIASGDGAPPWATLGASTDADFQDFWNNAPASNGVGIQTQFISLWQHIIGILDASPGATNVLGLDPFNEPYPGSGYASPCGDFDPCPAFETTQLDQFYLKVIAAMRASGYAHVIWPEGIADSGAASPSLPAFSDPQVAFNWHYYCTASQLLADPNGTVTTAYCKGPDTTNFDNVKRYVTKLNVPLAVSEFGGNAADAEYGNQVDNWDAAFASWMYWMYYNAATDPANSPTQGLLSNDNKPGSVSNVDMAKLKALVVPYAQAIAGTPMASSFDRASDRMTLIYSTTPVPGAKLSAGAQTQIFVPELDYPTGYTVQATGASVTSAASSPWVELSADRGASTVRVTITPASGGQTLLPSQTGAVPVPASATPPATKVKATCHTRRVVITIPARLRRGLTAVEVLVNGRVAQRLSGTRHAVAIRTQASHRSTTVTLRLTYRRTRRTLTRHVPSCT